MPKVDFFNVVNHPATNANIYDFVNGGGFAGM